MDLFLALSWPLLTVGGLFAVLGAAWVIERRILTDAPLTVRSDVPA